MTIIATKDKALSSVFLSDIYSLVEDYNYNSNQTAEETSETDYKIGQVVYWDTDHWRILKSTDFSTNVLDASESDLGTSGVSLGVVLGFNTLGGDKFTTTLEANTATNVVIGFQGPFAVKESGLVFDAGVTGASLANAKMNLAKQGIQLKSTAPAVSVSYYGA